jgi:hypothetical protein
MATPRVKSCLVLLRIVVIAPPSASEFVRVRTPSRAEIAGSDPWILIRCRSCCVPHVPAANTTCPAVKVREVRAPRHAPVRTVSTAYPALPDGRTATAVVSGTTVTPARSAR